MKTILHFIKPYKKLILFTIILIATVFVTKYASRIFERLQKFLDKMYAVIRENITGVRVIRALSKNADLYIFDDSFSALDFKTDSTLRAELAKKTKNKTVIIVAQRINTILNADQIIVLEDGKVVGKGTHEELIKTNETYKQIALSQLSEEELNIKDLNNKTNVEGGEKHE